LTQDTTAKSFVGYKDRVNFDIIKNDKTKQIKAGALIAL